jgi:NADH-quinone oxidoreductase subunit J
MEGHAGHSVFAPVAWGGARLLGAVEPAAGSGDYGPVISPVMILVLCTLAGIATVFLLPSRREAAFRKVGGILLLSVGLIFGALLVHYANGLYVGTTRAGGMSLYFWIFSAIAIVGAVRVVTHPRPVYSALYFVLSVLASAGLFILLWAEFMAAALVIIYAGAILVTYVFVIMLASQSSAATSQSDGDPNAGLAEYDRVSREPVIACAVGFALMGVLLFVIFDKAPRGPLVFSNAPAPTVSPGQQPGTVQSLGNYLFKNQLVNLELAGLILTLGMIGAILIARRRVVVAERAVAVPAAEVTVAPATPIDDNPHSIPVYGTMNPRAKAYPEA